MELGLERYLDLLEEDGEKLGLTGLRERADRRRELVQDPLVLVDRVTPGARVVDIGSGGGCPGIALAIARPDVEVTMIESNQRKAGFLVRAVAELGLNARVLAERSETLAQSPAHRARYDHATAKAVAAMPVLLELSIPFLKVGGTLLALKGPALAAELEQSVKAFRELGAELVESWPYQLEDRNYQLCVVRKLRPTPARYPRKPGTPAKTPL